MREEEKGEGEREGVRERARGREHGRERGREDTLYILYLNIHVSMTYAYSSICNIPCKKLHANSSTRAKYRRYFITRAHVIFRQLFCALIRRITGASERANYRVRTRIMLYARIRARLRRLHFF